MRKIIALGIVAAMIITAANVFGFSCNADDTSCTFVVYQLDMHGHPTVAQTHTISLVGPMPPLGDSNAAVTIRYDGIDYPIKWDWHFHPFGIPAATVTQNRIAVYNRYATLNPPILLINITAFDQTVFSRPYGASNPIMPWTSSLSALHVYGFNTSQKGYMWQEQNADNSDQILVNNGVPLGQYVVFSRTEIRSLPLHFPTTAPLPTYLDVISCSSSNACTINMIRPSDFGQVDSHSLSMAAYSSGNQQTFTYDGADITVTCDGTWQNLPTPTYPVPKQDQIACSINTGTIPPVSVNLKLWEDSATLQNLSYTEASPYSLQTTITQNTVAATGTAQVWETSPNMFSKTTVNNLTLMPQLVLDTSSDTVTGANDKQDDGTVDADGNCLGTIYIFNGKDKRCRTPGIEDAYTNCCNNGNNNLPVGVVAINPIFWGPYIISHMMNCSDAENNVSSKKHQGLCHYVGKYCSVHIPLIGCVQEKKTFCCFTSMLGRILQEQGRPTLRDFGPTGDWGAPKHPNCQGFTPEEFQNIDFSKVDLSEWYGHIQTTTQQQITTTMQNNINELYGN